MQYRAIPRHRLVLTSSGEFHGILAIYMLLFCAMPHHELSESTALDAWILGLSQIGNFNTSLNATVSNQQ